MEKRNFLCQRTGFTAVVGRNGVSERVAPGRSWSRMGRVSWDGGFTKRAECVWEEVGWFGGGKILDYFDEQGSLLF